MFYKDIIINNFLQSKIKHYAKHYYDFGLNTKQNDKCIYYYNSIHPVSTDLNI